MWLISYVLNRPWASMLPKDFLKGIGISVKQIIVLCNETKMCMNFQMSAGDFKAI